MRSLLCGDDQYWSAEAEESAAIKKGPTSERQNHLGSVSSGLAHGSCSPAVAKIALVLSAKHGKVLSLPNGTGFEGPALKGSWREDEVWHPEESSREAIGAAQLQQENPAFQRCQCHGMDYHWW